MRGLVMTWFEFVKPFLWAGLVFLLVLEACTRLEQWWVYGVSPLRLYDYDVMLYTRTAVGIAGRPNARYEKWTLNSLGMRGPEVALKKPQGTVRILCMGASETFGLHETADHEWPRRLERHLRASGIPVEVINASLVAMSPVLQVRHFEYALREFNPDTVLLMLNYPYFAGRDVPNIHDPKTALHAWVRTEKEVGPFSGVLTPRLLRKVKDAVLPQLPEVIQTGVLTPLHQWQRMRQQVALGPEYHKYKSVQPAEIAAYDDILGRWMDLSVKFNFRLVLLDPALWITQDTLNVFHRSWPYVAESWLVSARTQLAERAAQRARGNALTYVSLHGVVAGQEARLMRDMVHFSDEGAEAIALRIADALRPTWAHLPNTEDATAAQAHAPQRF